MVCSTHPWQALSDSWHWTLRLQSKETLARSQDGCDTNKIPNVLDFSWKGASDLISTAADVYCAKYVLACQEELKDDHLFFIATDQGQITRLPLHDTLIGAPRNMVVLAPPVVDIR